MEEIKRLGDSLYALELSTQALIKQNQLLHESSSLHEEERAEFLTQLKSKNSELVQLEKQKESVTLLTKALEQLGREKLDLMQQLEMASGDVEKLKNH